MEIIKPVFIVGTGRCGSTAFHRRFVRHPEAAFLSALLEKYPQRPYLNSWLMRALDIPALAPAARKVLPSECWNFWDMYGISGVCRDLVAEDVTPSMKERLRELLSRFLTGRRNRLLIKLSGWPRTGYFREIFPDARFIHIIRDGRAVANSLLNIGWWQGWKGPEKWGFGPLPGKYRQEWESYNRSFAALAGIEWKILMDSFREASAGLGQSDYLEVRYEDLCRDPAGKFRETADFCGFSFTERFESEIKSFLPLENRNFKWRQQLTPDQQRVLSELLRDHLELYGYLD
ncbi:MAG: sulfotransferase [Candidatus Krumholzibacteriales bacterium]